MTLALLLALSFGTAQAQDAAATAAPVAEASASGFTNSEYLHQAPGGKWELSPQLGINSLRREFKTSSVEYSQYQLALTVKGEYGITDLFSLAATLGTAAGGTSYDNCPSGADCDSERGRGLLDPEIEANLRLPVGEGTVRAGLSYSFSFSDSITEEDGDYNYATGGQTLTPYLGYEHKFGSNIIGAVAQYDVMKSDRKLKDEDPPETSYTQKEGQKFALAVFHEYYFPSVVGLATAIEYQDIEATKTDVTGTPSTTDNNGGKYWGLKFQVPLRFNETVTLIPWLSAGAFDYNSSRVTVKDQTHSSLNCMVRLTF